MESGRAELVVLYGRRRIGKTALVREMLEIKGGHYLYVEGPSVSRFLSKCGEVFNASFRSLDDFLEYVFKRSSEERIIVVFDEYQRISRYLSPKLQYYWDSFQHSARCKLFLLGSTVGMIERDIGYAGPLYGRATRIVKLRGFDYPTVRRVFPSIGERRALEVYSILGGTPHYVLMYDPSRGLRENIISLFLERGAPLYEEAERLLQTELREPVRYVEIMEAIARGKVTLKEISDYTGIERTKLKKYILVLERMDMIGKNRR